MDETDNSRLLALGEDTWSYAAAAAFLADASAHGIAAARDRDPVRLAVLNAAGLFADRELPEALTDPSRAHAMASVIAQAARAATGRAEGPAWQDLPDETLIAQGEASGMTGRFIAERVVPELDDLADRLNAGGRILDVGTGVGALATALVISLPGSRVLGIDVFERALTLAEARRATLDTGLAERISFEQRDVRDIANKGEFDLTWVPVPFLAQDSVGEALAACVGATAMGGWIVAGSSHEPVDERSRAVSRWSAARMGGSAAHTSDVINALGELGLVDVREHATLPGAPVLVAGRRAAEAGAKSQALRGRVK